MHIAVIGAGAFGGWTALSLLQRGAKATLIDAWGPGNSRSSSGGETRIIRAIYGSDLISMRFTIRSLELWKEYEQRWQTRLFFRTGMMFLAGPGDEFVSTSERQLAAAGVDVQLWSAAEASKRYPQISFDGIDSVLFEPDAGALTARENCRTVVKHFLAAGGTFRLASVNVPHAGSQLESLALSDGTRVHADQYVFACGPWLSFLFPDLLGTIIIPTRQDVLFFAVPPGDDSFAGTSFPCWADRTSEHKFYGIPDVHHRGFKIASDVRGSVFDPDHTDRVSDPESRASARQFLTHRFPALRDAPLLETRVCQYENTADLGFLIDRHPLASNVWLVGGGSGHGYKQGPAVGEYVASLIYGTVSPIPDFALARFSGNVTRRTSSL